MKNKWLGSTLGFIFLMAVTAQVGAAEGVISGCYKKNKGTLRIISDISECDASEAGISWNISGQQGPQGEPGPMGPAGERGPAGAIHVYDANNQYLGILVSHWDVDPAINNPTESLPHILMVFNPASKQFIPVNKGDGNVFNRTTGSLYYESPDCTGTPHAMQYGYIGVVMYDKYLKGYYKLKMGRKVGLASQSVWYGSNNQCVPSPSYPVVSFFEVAMIPEDQVGFQTPVAFPLAYELAD